ncbi:MAG: tetratricopeptide repeat protein [Armatimonadetes bacterium]|nr:tetratricopeptide repeat protein [Armatimonadota bacterium]
MSLWNELLAGETAAQAARSHLLAERIGSAVAHSRSSAPVTVDLSGIGSAIQGGLGNIASGMGDMADGVRDLAAATGRGLGQLSYQIDGLGSGIDQLNADFNVAIGDVIWKLQQHSDQLASILDTLRAPVGTEAYEYRQRGEDAYQNGWYEEAITDLRRSAELNYRDFAVHRTIGNIFFYHATPPAFSDAREAYERAAKYARPRDARQAAEAHLFAAFACMGLHDWQAARSHCSDATALNPRLCEAYYTHAQNAGQVADSRAAIQQLAMAVQGDPRYLIQARSDSLLAPVKRDVESWCADTEASATAQVDRLTARLQEFTQSNTVLTEAEMQPARSLTQELNAIRSTGHYPTLAAAIPQFAPKVEGVLRSLADLTQKKEAIRPVVAHAVAELEDAVYQGPSYIVRHVEPRIEDLRRSARTAYDQHSLAGYQQAQADISAAWKYAETEPANRCRALKITTQGVAPALMRRSQHESAEAQKRAQEAEWQREIWRANNRCLECGAGISLLDRMRGQTRCPKHR